MKLKEITDYLDNYLEIDAFRDDSTNGLQVANSGKVKKVGLAVDACHEAILKAGDIQCNLLIVHHGLFWGKQELMIDNHFLRVRSLIRSDLALYAAHLPLDGHAEVGHNVQIAKKVGLSDLRPFAQYYGKPIGIKGKVESPKSCSEIARDLEKAIGRCRALLAFGPERVHTIGVVSGSATDLALFKELKVQKVDLFITGEPKHEAYYLAQELGLNIFYGGHYLTETFGMRALGRHLTRQLSIPTEFINIPCIF